MKMCVEIGDGALFKSVASQSEFLSITALLIPATMLLICITTLAVTIGSVVIVITSVVCRT